MTAGRYCRGIAAWARGIVAGAAGALVILCIEGDAQGQGSLADGVAFSVERYIPAPGPGVYWRAENAEVLPSRAWSLGVTGMPEAIPALDKVSLVRLTSETSKVDSTYALSRPLFFYSAEDSPALQAFLDFVSTLEAQDLIVETGLYPAHQSDAMASD